MIKNKTQKVRLVNPNKKLQEEIKRLREFNDRVIETNRELTHELMASLEKTQIYEEAIEQPVVTKISYNWNGMFGVLFDLFIVIFNIILAPGLFETGHPVVGTLGIALTLWIVIKRSLRLN